MWVQIPLPLLFSNKKVTSLFSNFRSFVKDLKKRFFINFILKYGYIVFNYFYKFIFKRDYLFLNLDISNIAINEQNHYNSVWQDHSRYIHKLLYNAYLWKSLFKSKDIWTDRWVFQLFLLQYNSFSSENFRILYRLNFFKNGFYTAFDLNTPKIHTKNSSIFFLTGYKYFLKFFSKWFLPVTLVLTFVLYSMYVQALPAVRVAFVWLSLLSVAYLLISGFVFFFKKYQYGKFTSVIQRFWKRSLILFWLIEGGLLLVFFYLTINSTWYLFNVSDQSQLFRTFLFSWRLFLIKIIPLTLLILLTFIFLINNKWQTLTKNTLLLITITSLVIFITWVEFYQFYHIINYHHGRTWTFHKDIHEWVIDQDLRKTLGTKALVNVMLILKFWHVLFVTGMWLFFVLRSNESDRIRYPLIAGNFLNFIMLYVLSWVYMYPWIRLISKQYFSYVYKWFYVNNRTFAIRLFFNDLQLFLTSFCDIKYLFFHYFNLTSFKYDSFFFFKSSNHSNGFVDFNKRFVSNDLVTDLYNYSNLYSLSKTSLFNLWQTNLEIGKILFKKIHTLLTYVGVDNHRIPMQPKIFKYEWKGYIF